MNLPNILMMVTKTRKKSHRKLIDAIVNVEGNLTSAMESKHYSKPHSGVPSYSLSGKVP